MRITHVRVSFSGNVLALSLGSEEEEVVHSKEKAETGPVHQEGGEDCVEVWVKFPAYGGHHVHHGHCCC